MPEPICRYTDLFQVLVRHFGQYIQRDLLPLENIQQMLQIQTSQEIRNRTYPPNFTLGVLQFARRATPFGGSHRDTVPTADRHQQLHRRPRRHDDSLRIYGRGQRRTWRVRKGDGRGARGRSRGGGDALLGGHGVLKQATNVIRGGQVYWGLALLVFQEGVCPVSKLEFLRNNVTK